LLTDSDDQSAFYAICLETNDFWKIAIDKNNKVVQTRIIPKGNDLPSSSILQEALLFSSKKGDFNVLVSRDGAWYQYQKSKNIWIQKDGWPSTGGKSDKNYIVYWTNRRAILYHAENGKVWSRVHQYANSTFITSHAAKLGKYLHYSEITSPLSSMTVVGFRGTQSNVDYLHDAKLFIESVIPTFATLFIPLPYRAKESFALFFACFGSRSWPSGMDLIKIGKEKVKKLSETNPNVIVVGHSLGGALANVIGTSLSVDNYAISPPGISYGGKVYGFTESQMSRYMHSVVPQRDPVAALGFTSGNVVNIPCYEPKSLDCHWAQTTICTLSRLCNEDQDSLEDLCKDVAKG